MILSPLGAMLMPALKITPSQFGLVVSSYAFSAGGAGLLAAGFVDRFDRKRVLLFFYAGFVGGTLLCGMADSFEFLLVARIVTGLFGGVIGSIVFAITTDLFMFSMRGRVMGFVQTAFAASQVLGLPLGIYLANAWNWHTPFFMIVAVGALVGLMILRYLQPIDGHLRLKNERSAFQHLLKTGQSPRNLQGFAATALMAVGGFMLMPFSSAYSVHNLGVDLSDLPSVYMVTGLCAIIAGPLVGRASDRFGKFPVFLFGTAITIVMVTIYCNLGHASLAMVMLIYSLLFVGISARMIASQALMSAIPEPQSRGAYMAISSSIQQMAGGVAAVMAGHIVVAQADGSLLYFELIGYVVALASLFTLVMMLRIHRLVPEPARPASGPPDAGSRR